MILQYFEVHTSMTSLLIQTHCVQNKSRSLTDWRSVPFFTQLEEGTDGVWVCKAQDGIQHSLAELTNHSLALTAVGAGQDVTDLLQQFDDGALRKMEKSERASEYDCEGSETVCARVQECDSHLGSVFRQEVLQSLNEKNAEGARRHVFCLIDR